MAADPRFAPGQVRDGRLICGAKNKAGEPCRRTPKTGFTRCKGHGGGSPQAANKAKERIIEENARGILGRIDPSAPREHPIEMLLNVIQAKYAEVMWLRSTVQALTEDELVWGRVQHEMGTGPEGPIDKETFKAEQNIWWKLLREAENQLVSWNAQAIKAGIEAKELALKEREAGKVAEVINKILAAMELTPEQEARKSIVIPPILRAISANGN